MKKGEMDGWSWPLSRRDFLRDLALFAGSSCAPPLFRARASSVSPLHIVIIGAGLAGLCAAYELERFGHTVTVLEGRDRVGGRVRTVRFDGGLYGEAGAMRIPPSHAITRSYVAQFHLPLRRFVQSNPLGYYFLRGHKERIKDEEPIKRLYSLKPWEQKSSIGGLWEKALTTRVARLTEKERDDLFSVSPTTSAVRELDNLTVTQLCREAGLSDEATELLLASSGEEMLMHAASCEDIREVVKGFASGDFHEIIGGNDLLPAAFQKRLKAKPKLQCEVVGIEQDPGKWGAALYRDGTQGSRLLRVQGDAVLCTVPFPALQRIQVTPPFSPAKQRAIRQLNYEPSTKVLVATRKRFWESDEGIFGGGTFTDLPTGMTYYPSDNPGHDPATSAGGGVLLASYTWGQAARRLGILPERERCEFVINELSKVHPQLKVPGMVTHSASWSWDTDRWSGGAFAWFMPGQHPALQKDVFSREGRVYFAGEHTTLTHAWMQGALESALRAVNEIQALQR